MKKRRFRKETSHHGNENRNHQATRTFVMGAINVVMARMQKAII